jgi:hypothetical protein
MFTSEAMDVLYKYLDADGLADLVDNGRIRIGTLRTYRNSGAGPGVNDDKEGRRIIVLDSHEDARAEASRARMDQRPRVHGDVFVEPHRSGEVVVEERSPDLYMFSASLCCDRALMDRLQHDACVRINDPSRFFAELSVRMKDAARFLGFREVIYEDARNPKRGLSTIPPAFFKAIEYAYQAEVRAVWEPWSESIEPVVVTCPEAARLCELCLSRE